MAFRPVSGLALCYLIFALHHRRSELLSVLENSAGSAKEFRKGEGMRQVFELGEAEASLAIQTIREELMRRGKTAVIAVSDAHGELISLLRMDSAPLPSILVAMRKLHTASRERAETADVGKNFQRHGWQPANSDPTFTGWAGGVPVRFRGAVIGAVAVSGLSQEEDAEIARIGVAKILESVGS
jgi:glc operon protein GlcG